MWSPGPRAAKQKEVPQTQSCQVLDKEYGTCLSVQFRGDEPICYRRPLRQLPLSKRAAQIFSYTIKPN